MNLFKTSSIAVIKDCCRCFSFRQLVEKRFTKFKSKRNMPWYSSFWPCIYCMTHERISIKLCLLVYKAIHGFAPCYLNEMCTPVSTVLNLSALRSWWFGRTQNKATTRQPGILCGWSRRLEQSTTARSFGTYIINVQKHAQDSSVLTFLPHWPTVYRVYRVWAANIVRRPCSDSSHVTAPYTLSY